MPDGNQSGQTLSPEKHNWKLRVWADFLDRFGSVRKSVFGKLVNMAESWQYVGKGPISKLCKVCFLRIAAIHDKRSEGPQSALSAKFASAQCDRFGLEPIACRKL